MQQVGSNQEKAAFVQFPLFSFGDCYHALSWQFQQFWRLFTKCSVKWRRRRRRRRLRRLCDGMRLQCLVQIDGLKRRVLERAAMAMASSCGVSITWGLPYHQDSHDECLRIAEAKNYLSINLHDEVEESDDVPFSGMKCRDQVLDLTKMCRFSFRLPRICLEYLCSMGCDRG